MKTRVSEIGRYGDHEVIIYREHAANEVATLAFDLIERWGLVAAMPDGEDSAGRAKLRLPTSAELVARAFAIAEQALSCAHERGHMIALPDLNEVNAAVDAKRAARTPKAIVAEMAEALDAAGE